MTKDDIDLMVTIAQREFASEFGAYRDNARATMERIRGDLQDPPRLHCVTRQDNRFHAEERDAPMMRLSTMWAVDREIDEDGRSPIIDRIAERWRHDAGSARFFRSSANFIAVYERDGQRRFLRFADASERDRAAIMAELDVVLWLAAHGLAVALPEPSLSGAMLETVAIGGRSFHAVAFVACPGAQVGIEDLDDAGFHQWGEALGELHAALMFYPAAQFMERRSWRDDLAFIDRQIPEDAAEVRAELLSLRAALEAMPAGSDQAGLIHFDFELDNLVWGDGRIAMLDFDDCAHSWYAADIAFALRDLFDAGRALDDPAVRSFLNGYRARMATTEGALDSVPTFSRFARLLQYARIARSLDLDPGPEYPGWMNGLIGALRDRHDAYRASLFQRP